MLFQNCPKTQSFIQCRYHISSSTREPLPSVPSIEIGPAAFHSPLGRPTLTVASRPLHSLPLVLIGTAFEALRLRYNGCVLPWHYVWEQSNSRSRDILCLLEDSLLNSSSFASLPTPKLVQLSLHLCQHWSLFSWDQELKATHKSHVVYIFTLDHDFVYICTKTSKNINRDTLVLQALRIWASCPPAVGQECQR